MNRRRILIWCFKNSYHVVILAACGYFASIIERADGQAVPTFERIACFVSALVLLELAVLVARMFFRNSVFKFYFKGEPFFQNEKKDDKDKKDKETAVK